MAKPKYANGLGSRSDDHQPPLDYTLAYLRCSEQKRISSPTPSSAVLSALAIIAASPATVAGSPLPLHTNPPIFLCPSIERDLTAAPQNIQAIPTIPAIPPLPAHPSPSTSGPTPVYNNLRRRIADKYVQGMDNRWRKTDEWTLYGSACCSNGTPSPNVNDVQAWPSQSSSSQPSTTPLELDAASLPAGWHSPNSSTSGTEPTIILVISIVVAFLLCIFILTCICWRKSKRKRRDLEVKLQHKLRADDESEYGDQEKKARGKMRMWVKATARWKASVRHSARRRRKRQSAVSRVPRSQSSTPSNCPDDSVISLPRPSLQHSSPPSAVEGAEFVPITSTVDMPERAALPPDSQVPPEVPLPPAYRPATTERPRSAILHQVSLPDLSSLPSRRTSVLSDPGSPPPVSHTEPIPYIPPATGHVSTDDKSDIARRIELASAPPDSSTSTTSGNSAATVSVPAYDVVSDELDGYPELEPPYSSQDFLDMPSIFPSPPSKAMMAFSYHEDFSTPVDEPSGDGPFIPSAPPAIHPNLEPSAPSLEDEDENEALGTVADQVGHTPHSHPLVTPSDSPSFRKPPSSTLHGIPPSYHP